MWSKDKTVSLSAYEQCKWERDIALFQLESYGVSLGEDARVVNLNKLDGKDVKNIEHILSGDYAEVSDGDHTFDDLYYHRMVLTAALCNVPYVKSWKSLKHHDGTMFEGYFVIGIVTDDGYATYHYPTKYWDYFVDVEELEKAPEWDGHDSTEAIRRIGAEFGVFNREDK